ncbi:MAG: DegV family protein [Chloroflexi bacterium]|nr:DegV family protein [Chloroflexota bacterium]
MVTDKPVRIVTDGSVAVRPGSIARFNITVVPCGVTVGGKTLVSNADLPIAQLAGQIKRPAGAKIRPPAYGDFLQAYRQLRQAAIISIHGAPELGEFVKPARLARNLLPQRDQVTLFEAPTIGLGLAFLVEIAAQAAERGDSRRAVRLMLERIRDEGLRTVILAQGAGELLERAGVTDRRYRFKALLPGVEALFAVDPASARLKLLAQERNLGTSLLRRNDMFGDLAHPCDAMIVHVGYEALAQALANRLPDVLGGKQIKVYAGGLDMTPYVRGNYLAIIVHPVLQVLEQIERFAVRMDRIFK